MINVYKPPIGGGVIGFYSIFLAGSIEMGKAEDWQTIFTEYLKSASIECGVDIYNPRRDDWDASWKQDPTPGTKFEQQVTWELDEIAMSDLVVFNFVADTVSPITLLELGLTVGENKNVIVHCPKNYFRYGNVAIVCRKYNVPMVETFDELCKTVVDYIEESMHTN